MVTVSFTLGVSIDSFDAAAQQTFKVNLAAQLDGISSSVILLTVEAGSLVVAVQIPTSTAEDADTLVTTLSSDQPMNALSAALGYTIEATSIPAVKMVELAAPSPPLPVPPLSPVTIESSDSLDFDSATYCSAEYLTTMRLGLSSTIHLQHRTARTRTSQSDGVWLPSLCS